MSYKDTLTLYDELIAKGTSEPQARIQVQQLGGLSNIMEKIEKDLFWLRVIGGAMAVGIMGILFK